LKRKWLFIVGLVFSAALGSLLPQWIVGNVEGSAAQVTYHFVGLGMHTNEERGKVKEILDHVVGIEEYKIDPQADQVTITFDKETMKAEWIVKSLDAQGFTPDSYSKFKPEK
jgi:copper chaperone CopZ